MAEVLHQEHSVVACQAWTGLPLAEVCELLDRADDTPELAQAFLDCAGALPGLVYGVVHLYLGPSRWLRCIGRSGAAAHVPEHQGLEDGWAGRCALEKRRLLLTDALPTGPLACVFLLPVLYRDAVVGVVELALAHHLSNEQQHWVAGLMPALGRCLDALRLRARIATLTLALDRRDAQLRMMKQLGGKSTSVQPGHPRPRPRVDGARPRPLMQPAAESLAVPATDPAVPPRRERLRALRGARVLVVEDNRGNQRMAEDLLQQVGLVVEVADSGRVAVQMAQARPYDMVLMELQMPEMDGVETTKRLHAVPALSALPIIATTTDCGATDLARCQRAGMVDFISKPIDPEALCSTLLRWVAPRRHLSPSTRGRQGAHVET